MTRGVAVLGSTGSIGKSTLAVLARQREHFRLVALTGGCNRADLEAQAAEWNPDFVGLAETQPGSRYPTGPEVLLEAALHPDVDIVVNAVVGIAGLDATLAALGAGKRVALASKETLVMVEGGSLEISEAEMLEALKVAQKGIKDLIALERKVIDAEPRPKIAWEKPVPPAELVARVRAAAEASMVALVNLGTEPFSVTRGMRIAQMVIARVDRADFTEVAELPKTERGVGGFGSTGVGREPAGTDGSRRE